MKEQDQEIDIGSIFIDERIEGDWDYREVSREKKIIASLTLLFMCATLTPSSILLIMDEQIGLGCAFAGGATVSIVGSMFYAGGAFFHNKPNKIGMFAEIFDMGRDATDAIDENTAILSKETVSGLTIKSSAVIRSMDI